MRRATIALVSLAVALAALFVRLGFWQVHRLGERRARNADISTRLAQPTVAFERLPDTSSFRRATVTGIPDTANELVLTGRSRDGSPGVYILTPMRRAAGDSAVIVIRGWVYAPDASSVDLTRWRENRAAHTGYVAVLPEVASAPAARDRKMRTLDRATVRAALPYPVTAMYLVALDSADETAPARLTPPALDDGPHLSYAIQWFAFAAIALAGAVVVARRRPGGRSAGATGARQSGP